MVVRDPFAQDPSEMSLVKGDQPVQTLPSYRADQPLAKGVRLRRPHGRLKHSPSHRRNRPIHGCPVDPIPVMEHEPIGGVGREDDAELLDRPVRCRMLSHIPMDNSSHADFEHDEDIQDTEQSCS